MRSGPRGPAGAVVGLVTALLLSFPALAAPGPGLATVRHVRLAPGIEHEELRGAGPPLAVNVARVAPGTAARVRVLLSNDRVAPRPLASGTETTSSMCARAGGVVCVNGDFFRCPSSCRPVGGVVIDGQVLRTPTPVHEQLSVTDGGFYAGTLSWAGTMTAIYETVEPVDENLLDSLLPGTPPPERRTETRQMTLDGVNVARAEGLVVFTPAWAASTQTSPRVEVVVRAAGPLLVGHDMAVEPVSIRDGAGDTPIPPDGFVLSAAGAAADDLRAFVRAYQDTMADTRRITMRIDTSPPVVQTVGAHPVLLRNGEVVANPRDAVVVSRQPRTVIGWNDAGQLWLVTIDGRQPGRSVGMTLHEAAALLQSMGATGAVNLDGGGSSTFVTAGPCGGSGPCVQNQPSDGRERPVTTALAVMPDDPASVAPAVVTPAAASPREEALV
ncbi:MAG: phosphodiester glycosidase family protein, partial [Acidimicrobiales bacterium]